MVLFHLKVGVTVRLPDLLSRTDDQALQELLGKSSLRLLQALDPSLATPSSLQKLIVDLYTPEGLLLLPDKRSILFDALPEADIKRLAIILGLNNETNTISLLEKLKRLRIKRNTDKETALFNFFELDAPNYVQENRVQPVSQELPGYSLFPHQRRAVRKVEEKIFGKLPRAILHMPTGSGKTRTAMNIIANHLRKHEPALVIWLAYSEELCEQAVEEFKTSWLHLGDREINIYRFWGDYFVNVEEIKDGILIAGLSKIYSATKKDLHVISELGKRVTLIIIDEAHTAVADTYKMILEALLAHRSEIALFGLTATPGRTWNDINVDEELSDFFFRQKVILEIEGYKNPVLYLEKEGYLAKAEFTPLLHNGGLNLSPADIGKINESFDIPSKILQRLAADEMRNLKIIVEVEKLSQSHSRILVFGATVDHSDLLATILRARGFHASSITSKTSTEVRRELIDDYKDNSPGVKILCNYGVLTTGFDAPRTSAAVIARPTKSLVLYSQMVGRATRGVKAGGNPTAQIITVVDQELPGFTSVADAFENWEDVWE